MLVCISIHADTDTLCFRPKILKRVIYRFTLAQMECKISVLLNNCRQNITPLSLLVGMTGANI